MRKVARRLLITSLALGSAVAVLLFSLYVGLRHEPKFYRQTLIAPAEERGPEGQRFERAALALHNQLQHAGPWEARLTQDEINGWLAVDLPAKFPQALPPGVSDPRVVFEEGMMRIAARYQRPGVKTVLSLAGEVYLTEQPNEIAVRIDAARAGLVPIPLGRLMDDISQRLGRSNVSVRWGEVRGAPLALVRLPLEADSHGRQLVIERLLCGPGQIVLGGRTEEPGGQRQHAQAATAPQSTDKETRQR